MENVETLLNSLTLEEKAALVAGTDFMHTNPVPRLKIPSLCMADGPHGLRKQAGEQDNGISHLRRRSQRRRRLPAASTRITRAVRVRR